VPAGVVQQSQCLEPEAVSRDPRVTVGSPGGEWALGVGLALANQSPRCSRILRIASGFSIAATYVKLRIVALCAVFDYVK